MATVLNAFRKTTTDALSTISAATTSLTHLADAASAGSETLSLHAQHHRNVTARRLSLTEEEYEDIAEQQARLKIARATFAIETEINSDPELKAIYDRISLTKHRPVQLHAAE